MNSIIVNKLSRNYGNGKGVFNLSFTIPEGEVFGYLGPNGAGKTTTIRHLMGYLKPENGSCYINGLNCWENAAEIQCHLGYIPGEIAFFDDMHGDEYLDFVKHYRGMKSNQKQKELIERFELNPKGKIRKMSKGMKQKIAIVSAFMHDPQILILDEPTSGLDPLMQNRFIELILEEKNKGKTILMSSHMFEEVERTCDRIAMIKDGRLVALESTEELSARHLKSYTVTLKDENTACCFAQDFHGVQGTANRNQVTLHARQSLEDIFLHYYQGGDK